MISQDFTRRIIRVYDAAGNVIETHEHAGRSESGEDFYSHCVALAPKRNCPKTRRDCASFALYAAIDKVT